VNSLTYRIRYLWSDNLCLNGGVISPTSINQQLDRLREGGLVISSEQEHEAGRLVLNRSFFRLSEYLECVPEPSDFSLFRDIVESDQELRDALLRALARLEIAFRSRFAYFFTGHDSPTSYLSEKSFQEPHRAGRRGSTLTPVGIIDALHSDIERSKEPFAHDHSFHHPIPLSHAIEVLTMGTLSKAYDGLANSRIKTDIAHSFDYEDPELFGAVFRSLTDLRNSCAHHVRLWHKRPRFPPPMKRSLQIEREQSIYHHTPWAWLVSLDDLTDHLENSQEFSERLSALVTTTPGFREGLTHPRER
jgi:abortive infection bacteriophage resistance protein